MDVGEDSLEEVRIEDAKLEVPPWRIHANPNATKKTTHASIATVAILDLECCLRRGRRGCCPSCSSGAAVIMLKKRCATTDDDKWL